MAEAPKQTHSRAIHHEAKPLTGNVPLQFHVFSKATFNAAIDGVTIKRFHEGKFSDETFSEAQVAPWVKKGMLILVDEKAWAKHVAEEKKKADEIKAKSEAKAREEKEKAAALKPLTVEEAIKAGYAAERAPVLVAIENSIRARHNDLISKGMGFEEARKQAEADERKAQEERKKAEEDKAKAEAEKAKNSGAASGQAEAGSQAEAASSQAKAPSLPDEHALGAMNKAALTAQAQVEGVAIDPEMTKAQIAAKILEARSAGK